MQRDNFTVRHFGITIFSIVLGTSHEHHKESISKVATAMFAFPGPFWELIRNTSLTYISFAFNKLITAATRKKNTASSQVVMCLDTSNKTITPTDNSSLQLHLI